MFRSMRRIRQEMSQEQAQYILIQGTSGVLALYGDDGYPYAVPVSYLFVPEENALYFHCAATGHKIDAVLQHDKASFYVVAQDKIVPELLTTNFISAIAFGRIHILEEPEEKRKAVFYLFRKYAPAETAEFIEREINSVGKALCMLKFEIERLSTKQGKELLPKMD